MKQSIHLIKMIGDGDDGTVTNELRLLNERRGRNWKRTMRHLQARSPWLLLDLVRTHPNTWAMTSILDIADKSNWDFVRVGDSELKNHNRLEVPRYRWMTSSMNARLARYSFSILAHVTRCLL